MPAQQRVRRRDRGDLAQSRTPTRPRSRQPAAIIVGETQPPDPKLAPQEPVLLDQVGDRPSLPALEPAGQHAQHHLQRRRVALTRSGMDAMSMNAVISPVTLQ